MKGFTLVELLVATVVVAVGIVGVLRSFISSAVVLDHIRNRLAAVHCLDEKAAGLVIEAWSGAESYPVRGEEPVGLGVRQAVLRYSGMRVEEGLQEGMDRLTISVSWKERELVKETAIILLEKSGS